MIWYLDPKSNGRYNTLSVSRHLVDQRFVCWQHWMSRLWIVKFHSSFFSHVSPMSGRLEMISTENRQRQSYRLQPSNVWGQILVNIEDTSVNAMLHRALTHHPAVTLSMFYVALSQVSAASSTDKKQDAQAGCGKAATDIKVFWSRQCHICGQDFLECGGGWKMFLKYSNFQISLIFATDEKKNCVGKSLP